MIKIEKDIPIPEKPINRWRNLFVKMEVGDSFFVEGEDKYDLHDIQGSIIRASYTKGRNFSITTKPGRWRNKSSGE